MITHTLLSKETIERIDTRKLVDNHLDGKGTQWLLYVNIKFAGLRGNEGYVDEVTLNVFNSAVVDRLIVGILDHFVADAAVCISEDDSFAAQLVVNIK